MGKQFDFVEMKIPSKTEYIGVVRLTVSGIASRMGFDYEDIEDIKVAVSEAITNAIHHGFGENEGEVGIGFGVHKDRLEIMVADNGQSFDAEEVRKNTGPYSKAYPIDTLPEGGLGLYLIETLMDSLEINDESGVVVIMTKLKQRDEVGEHEDSISTSKTQ